MHCALTANCTVVDPGPWRVPLRRLATFRRKGRLPQHTGRWVRLYHDTPESLTVPVGLWRQIRDHYPVAAVQDRRMVRPEVGFGWRGTLYDYQDQAARAVMQLGGGLLVAPPGAGKTLIGLALMAWWRQPTLWLAPTRDLVEQAHRRALALCGELTPWNVGLVGLGEDDSLDPRMVLFIGTVQTLGKRPDIVQRLAGRVGTVIVDEGHHAPADSIRNVLVRLPARYKLALSATPDRTDGLGPMIRALFGPMVRVRLDALVQLGRISKPTVYRVRTGFRTSSRTMGWAELDRSRSLDRMRLGLTVRLLRYCQARNRRVLVLVTRIDHARALATLCREAGIPAAAVTGAVPTGLRQRYYAALEAGNLILIATRLADEGLDWPRLDTLVLAAAGRSDVRLQQQVGRIMRTVPGKPTPWVIDLVDPHVRTFAYHARIRRWVYQKWDLVVEEGVPE